MRAIILAAGIGSRLMPITKNKPKTMVSVNNRPMIHYILESLIENNIEDITICTGYESSKLISYCNNNFKAIRFKFVPNYDYNNTNNMYSLYLARESLYGDCIIMNADLIYDSSIIKSLVDSGDSSVICIDKGKYLEESMKVTVDGFERINGISKIIPKIDAYGVSIDIYKFNSTATEIIKKELILEIEERKVLNNWTEVLFDKLMRNGQLEAYPLDINGRRWHEIDDYKDLSIAEERFNPELTNLKEKKVFVFDFDGTLFLGNNVIAGAFDVIEKLLEDKKIVYLMTNNSSKTVSEYEQKLSAVTKRNFKINIINSLDLALDYFERNGIKKVFLVANEVVEQHIINRGFMIDSKNPQALLLTFDTQLNYEKLIKLVHLINEGVPYYATHLDKVCPTENGFVPDIGTFIDLLHTTTGILPLRTFGKPSYEVLHFIINSTGVSEKDIVVIGDRLYTDIKMCEKTSVTSILVLSGETTREMYEESEISASIVLQSVSQMESYI